MDAITVNKGPIAWGYRRLTESAAAQGRRLLFEGAVMDGCPVFSLFVPPGSARLPAARFRGGVQLDHEVILDAMGEGVGFADALAQVQAAGYAEADPSHDIDGHDAAAKTVVLANVLMGALPSRPTTCPKTASAASAPRGWRRRWPPAAACGVVCLGPARDAAGGGFFRLLASTHPHVRLHRACTRASPVPPPAAPPCRCCCTPTSWARVQIAEHDALPEQTAYARNTTPTCWPSTKVASPVASRLKAAPSGPDRGSAPGARSYSASARAPAETAVPRRRPQSTWSLRCPSRSLNWGASFAMGVTDDVLRADVVRRLQPGDQAQAGVDLAGPSEDLRDRLRRAGRRRLHELDADRAPSIPTVWRARTSSGTCW